MIAICEGLVACEDAQSGCLSGARFPQVLDIAQTPFWLDTPAGRTVTLSPTRDPLRPRPADRTQEDPMSIAIVSTIEPDGTLRYDCGQDIAIRVALHQRNGQQDVPGGTAAPGGRAPQYRYQSAGFARH